jgi:hypothetical protein
VVEGPVSYGPEGLYDYLDGGAERYLGLGFEKLVHVRYQLGEDPLACVTLDLYEMGGTAGAFGIYRSVRRPTRAATVVRRGHSLGTAGGGASTSTARPMTERARGRARQLHRASLRPGAPGERAAAFLEPLPAEGLVPQSERWFAADLLGHAFLPGGVTASYRIDGREARLYYSELDSDQAAAQALARLRDEWARRTPVDDLHRPARRLPLLRTKARIRQLWRPGVSSPVCAATHDLPDTQRRAYRARRRPRRAEFSRDQLARAVLLRSRSVVISLSLAVHWRSSEGGAPALIVRLLDRSTPGPYRQPGFTFRRIAPRW